MPDWALALFQSGLVAEIAIGVLVIETALLLALRLRVPLSPSTLVLNAASGIALMLALRAALSTPQNFGWVAIWLTVGFIAHLADLRTRIKSKN